MNKETHLICLFAPVGIATTNREHFWLLLLTIWNKLVNLKPAFPVLHGLQNVTAAAPSMQKRICTSTLLCSFLFAHLTNPFVNVT